jgi:hypothetical protein
MEPDIVEGVDIDEGCDWDEEAIANAIQTAQMLEDGDPAGAKQLMAQAQWAKQRLAGTTDLREPYDAMAVRARLLRFYKGAITDEGLDRMDYRRYLGYVREAELIAEEENKASKGPGNNVVDAGGLGGLQAPEQYTGEVIKLI